MQLLTETTKSEIATTTTNSSSTNATQAAANNMAKFYPPKPKINAFNQLFTCHLCQGYIINPTTIDECIHTYCRSCIVRHLASDNYCPQCKTSGGKAISIANLKSDDVLRSIILKLVPGLYQKEREHLVQFVNNTKKEESPLATTSNALCSASQEFKHNACDNDETFLSPTDPISLSLEYHPHLANQCPEDAVPPVRYLQCPASVKMQHLKRFLCSKFDIDPCNRRLGIEIIYEDEVLPSDFTLMDVGYCYKWERNAPLKFFYRILIYDHIDKPDNATSPVDKVSANSTATTYLKEAVVENKTQEQSLHDAPDAQVASPFLAPTPVTTKVKSSKHSSSSKHGQSPAASSHTVKMTITSKPAESKKSVSKRSSGTEDFILPPTTNDFKSLRSNDIRYSHYVVTTCTTSSTSSCTSSSSTTTKEKVKTITVKEEKPAKCDIVVSIPQNQFHEEWESKPLSQLKTASKKSPPACYVTSFTSSVDATNSSGSKKVKNVPKLKIELNSLKSKLIEKPKSADIRLDSLMIKHHKPRKFSLDETHQPSNNNVDLETYVKNIGLKPIEVQTNVSADVEMPEKFTPNASPRSSCSSSTTSSSNGYLHLGTELSTSSSSSHKKRKKKHSKEPRDSKRKKLHAEISSHAPEESLKMKVKLTAPMNIKSSKLESKKSPSVEKSFAVEKAKSVESKVAKPFERPLLPLIKPKVVEKEKPTAIKEKSKASLEKKSKDAMKLKPLAIKTSAKEFEDDEDVLMSETTSTLSLSKPLMNLQETKLPHSPPLPPSLFKTTPLTFSTFTPNAVTVAKPKAVSANSKPTKEKPVQSIKMKPLAPKPMPVKYLPAPMKPPQFAVPNLPRLMASNSSKFLTSTPSSIASSANKHMGDLLKRSASLDETKTATGSMMKQMKLERPHQITVSAYGSNLQVTRVEVPATPTSSTAKATYEIPLYSPLSASYNPKCSFSVGSSTTKSTKLNLPSASNVAANSANKSQVFTTSNVAAKRPDIDVKAAAGSLSSTLNASQSYAATKSSLMGPPLPLTKTNATVPTMAKSPPLSSILATGSGKIHSHSNTTPPGIASSRASMYQSNSSQLAERKTDLKASSSKTTNGSAATEKPKSSLRQFRLPSRDSGPDVLDLSSAPKTTNGLLASEKKTLATVSIPVSSSCSTSGTSLELALTKIKQNINNSSGQDKTTTLDLKPNSDDLQNLHLLSESATAREKIAISCGNNLTSTSSLYEKPKINQNSLVRQQNASVRSIPNPSALAFRNHQPTNNIPMVTIAVPLVASLSNDADRLLLSKPPSPPKSPASAQTFGNCSSSSSSPSRTTTTSSSLSTKRHASIDQVAASLNIRASAAAAAEASAKANIKHLDESATSSLTDASTGSKLKQIKQEAVEQTTTTSTSSAVAITLGESTEMVEIKKEPEEEQRDIRALVATTNNSGTSIMSAATTVPSSIASRVEHLVTSVINVSTPTSTLLTASSAAGY